MKKKISASFIILILSMFFMVAGSGCGNGNDEALQKLIQTDLNLLETEITAMEKNQENMRVIIGDMQKQLDIMQTELDKETPRIHAANVAIDSLRNLTTYGMGPSAAEQVINDPAWSYSTIMILFLLLFIVWLLYRVKHNNANG
jgi:hypothetical protein